MDLPDKKRNIDSTGALLCQLTKDSAFGLARTLTFLLNLEMTLSETQL